jgi:ParB family chromosome partitioning protein
MATANPKIILSRSQEISFYKLVLSQANVRRVKAAISIEDLAEDIANRTQLQSLCVRPVCDADGTETNMLEVAAGARSHRGYELLARQKRMAKTRPVPCVTCTNGLAKEDSLVEKVQHAALHALDQFQAFQEPTSFTDGMVERLKAMGVISQIIAWRLRLFVPTGSQGPTVLAALAERYKLTGLLERAAA